MKTLRLPLFCFLFLLSFTLTSCEAIGDIFKGGALFGVVGVFLVVLLLWWLVRKMRGGSGPA
jgi:membrane-bound metal-dependent hydrolase YbcI (DUF457 family)